MSKDHVTIPLGSVSPTPGQGNPGLDLNDVEMVFGRPGSSPKTGSRPAIHYVNNEKRPTADEVRIII